MAFSNKSNNMDNLRVIKTARDKKSINEAAANGFKPLMKKVEPSKEICSKYAVMQHKETGIIEIVGDFRSVYDADIYQDFVTVIDWTFYYPHHFKSPYAAYLIPKDIKVGESVFVEDLIEDFIGSRWNQGDTYRLDSCEAVWNGTDLEIQYNPNNHRSDFIG